MATEVSTALDELHDALGDVGPEYEGLLDYQRLNLKPDTRREVDEAINDYSRRLGLMNAAQAALEALVNDGYPDLSVRAIAATAFEDLQANAASIEAALKKFSSNQASALTVTAGEPQPKP
jgi:hypothetical protein